MLPMPISTIKSKNHTPERGGRPYNLEQAENIRQQYRSALGKIRDFQTRPILKLGVVCTLPISSISNLVSGFRTQYPPLIYVALLV